MTQAKPQSGLPLAVEPGCLLEVSLQGGTPFWAFCGALNSQGPGVYLDDGVHVDPRVCTVLLPSPDTLTLAEGLAAWDSHCTGEADSGHGRIWQLEDGYMTLHRKDDGPWYPVYWLWNDWEFGGGYVTPENYEMHNRDTQKYGVLVDWWKRLNAGGGGG